MSLNVKHCVVTAESTISQAFKHLREFSSKNSKAEQIESQWTWRMLRYISIPQYGKLSI